MDEGFRRGHGSNLMPIWGRASITFVHAEISLILQASTSRTCILSGAGQIVGVTSLPQRKNRPVVTVGEMSRRAEEIRSGTVAVSSMEEMEASFEKKKAAALKRRRS
jgi:hypothetical protein